LASFCDCDLQGGVGWCMQTATQNCAGPPLPPPRPNKWRPTNKFKDCTPILTFADLSIVNSRPEWTISLSEAPYNATPNNILESYSNKVLTNTSNTHSIYLFIYLFIDWLIDWLIDLFIYLFIYLFIFLSSTVIEDHSLLLLTNFKK